MNEFLKKIRQNILQIFIGIFFTVVGLWFAFKDVEIKEIVNNLKNINFFYLFLFAISTILSLYIRGIRWHYLARHHKKISSYESYKICSIGFALNSLLPLRAGEIARAVYARKNLNLSFSFAISMIIVERIYDFLIILSLFVPLFYNLNIDPSFKLSFKSYTLNKAILEMLIKKVSIIAALGVIFLILIQFPFFQKLGFVSIRLIKGIFSYKIYKKILHSYLHLIKGFHSFKKLSTVMINIVLSFLVWFFIGISFYFMALGMNINLSIKGSFIVMLMICFGVMIPSSPGYWGLYELAGKFAMLLLGYKPDISLAYTLMVHFWQTLVIVGLGLFYLFESGLSLSQVLSSEKNE